VSGPAISAVFSTCARQSPSSRHSFRNALQNAIEPREGGARHPVAIKLPAKREQPRLQDLRRPWRRCDPAKFLAARTALRGLGTIVTVIPVTNLNFMVFKP